MNETQFETALNLKCDARYDYFLKKVADWGELWILVNEDQQFLKLFSEEDQIEYVPVWPHADFASDYAKNTDDTLLAKKISLEVFFDRWIPGLQRDELQLSVFPNADDTVWIIDIEDFQEDLEAALSR
jgi:hypothetical protein